MPRRFVLSAIGAFSGLILIFSTVAGEVAEVGFAVVATAFPVALMLLGVARGERGSSAAARPIFLLFVLLELCLVGMLLYRGQVASGPWVLGLPAAAAIQLYGIFIAPLALVALGYALSFRELEVSDEDLERLRRASPDQSSGEQR